MCAKGLEMLQIIDTIFILNFENAFCLRFSVYIVNVQTLLGTCAEFADII